MVKQINGNEISSSKKSGCSGRQDPEAGCSAFQKSKSGRSAFYYGKVDCWSILFPIMILMIFEVKQINGYYCAYYHNTQVGKCADNSTYFYTSQTGVSPDTCYLTYAPSCASSTPINAPILADCMPKCHTCSDGASCLTCEGGHYSPPDCFDCQSHCNICPNSLSCTACYWYAYMEGATGNCIPCNTKFGTNCASCTETQCKTCGNYLYMNLTLASTTDPCFPCPEHCLGCTDGPTCSGCTIFFNFTNNSCIPKLDIQYCLNYNYDATCALCQPGFIFNSLICVYTLPIPYCQIAETTGVCKDCYVPFQKSNDKVICSPKVIIKYCQTYVSADGNCLTCLPAFQTGGNVCLIKVPIDHCQIYEDDGSCKSCFAAFTKGTAPICNITNLIIHCQIYENNGTCKSCYSAFTKSGDSLHCTITIPTLNCQSYHNDGTCQTCFTPFLLQPNSSCYPKYPIMYCQFYFDSDGSCKSCFAPFTKSSDSLVCTITHPIKYCQFYQYNGTCKSCFSAFSKSADSLKCSITIPIPHCQGYENDGKCQACTHTHIQNFALEADKLGCFDCKTVSKVCFQCTDQHKCKKCNLPYLVDPFGLCDMCSDGYRNVSGSCISNDGCSSQHTIGSINICLGCSPQLYFQYNQILNKCVCQSGYKNIKQGLIQKCISVCGNGILAHDQECDDNNLSDNDGCSKVCKKQSGFTCTPKSPSECSLLLKIDDFLQNYAQKIDGQNKCKFSFSVTPFHVAFQNVNWQYYLTTNLTQQYIVQNSKVYKFQNSTNEITLEFEYIKNIENVVVQATLVFDNSPLSSALGARLLQSTLNNTGEINYMRNLEQNAKNVSSSTYPKLFMLVSNPSSRSLTLTIEGINQRLNFQKDSLFSENSQANVIASNLYVGVSVLILVQFIISSYWHKMIGLETIQIFQFIYAVRTILNQDLQPYFKSINVLEYTVFGGYNHWEFFFSISQGVVKLVTKFSDNIAFNSIGLLKYFTLNINISLIPLVLFLLIYLYFLIKKYYERSKYIEQESPDGLTLYIVTKRKSQWIYNHLLFPLLMLFSLVSFFVTILYFNSLQLPSSILIKYQQTIEYLECINIPVHIVVLFLTSWIYCYEMFLSYQQYQYSKLTVSQKGKASFSIVQKLQRDENNVNDLQNYKPGYVLVYLIYYFILQIMVAISLFATLNAKSLILYVMVSFAILYEIILFVWNPYYQSVNVHNHVIKYNHFVLVLFLVFLLIATTMKDELSLQSLIIINYLSILLLVLVAVLGYVRILYEYRFRQKLSDSSQFFKRQIDSNHQQAQKKPVITDFKAIKAAITKRELLLHGNKFVFHQKEEQNAQNIRYNEKTFLNDRLPARMKNMNENGREKLKANQFIDLIKEQNQNEELLSKEDLKKRLNQIKQKIKKKSMSLENQYL